jgi:hypothetical protein
VHVDKPYPVEKVVSTIHQGSLIIRWIDLLIDENRHLPISTDSPIFLFKIGENC